MTKYNGELALSHEEWTKTGMFEDGELNGEGRNTCFSFSPMLWE